MLDFILENKKDLWLAFTTIVTFASIIAKLTPTSMDDKIIGKILTFIAINKK